MSPASRIPGGFERTKAEILFAEIRLELYTLLPRPHADRLVVKMRQMIGVHKGFSGAKEIETSDATLEYEP